MIFVFQLYTLSLLFKLNFMEAILLFGMPGGAEWLVIAFFVLVFFGAKKIPEFARGIGKGIREFKDAVKDVKKEVDDVGHETKRNLDARSTTGHLEEGDRR